MDVDNRSMLRVIVPLLVLLIIGSTGATGRIDTEMFNPSDIKNEDEVELFTTLTDPHDPEEAVLEIVVEVLDSCVSVPTFRTHSLYGSVLMGEVECLTPEVISEVYHDVLMTIDLNNPLEYDQVRSETLKALYETIECCATNEGGDDPSTEPRRAPPMVRLEKSLLLNS